MVTVSEIRTIEIPMYREYFSMINDLFGSFDGTYYKLNVDGKEYILHRLDQYFTLLSNNGLEVHNFVVDDNYNITGLAIDDKFFYYIDGRLVSKDKNSGMLESISLVKRNNGNDYDGYNGYVQHVQYDPNSDYRIIQSFQHMYNPEERIYDMHLKNPLSIVIEEHASKTDSGEAKSKSESFIKSDYDIHDDPIGFNIATIKEYGLRNFLKNGSYSLQKKDTITRYYRVLKVLKNGYAVTLFPLCRQYTQDEIYSVIEKNGFNKGVSELLLDVYNNDYELLALYQEVVATIKEVEMSNDINTLELNA